MWSRQKFICACCAVLVVACGGGDGDRTAPSNDTGGGIVNQGGNAEQVDEQGSTLEKLIGPEGRERVWVCERTDVDGGVRDTVVEFGELPQFDRAWLRFISPGSGTTDSLWRLTINNANDLQTFRLAVPGIERRSSFMLTEYEKRTRFFGDVVMNGSQSFTAAYVERRSTGPDLRPEYRCSSSTRDQAILADAPGWPSGRVWPSTPDIQEVAGLQDTSSRWFGATDACDDGSAIDLQFFETFNGVETGARWPAAQDTVYVIDSDNQGVNLRCAYGTDVCYSASPRDGRDYYWGLNPDLPVGERSCEGCCYSCPLPGFAATDVVYTMSCN